jgi:hypothetical protein
MSNQIWWRLCLAAGIIVIVIQAVMATVEGTEACGGDGSLASILVFELVRSPADVDALFGDEPCRSRLSEAMDQINTIDVFAFIPAFVSFLAFGALSVRSQGRRRALLAIVAAIVAGLCDQIEDQILFDITANLPGTQPQIDWLFFLVRAKFALLGIAPILIGSLLMTVGRSEFVLGLVMIGGGVAATVGTLGPYQLMGPGIASGWVALLIAAVRNSFWSTTDECPRAAAE